MRSRVELSLTFRPPIPCFLIYLNVVLVEHNPAAGRCCLSLTPSQSKPPSAGVHPPPHLPQPALLKAGGSPGVGHTVGSGGQWQRLCLKQLSASLSKKKRPVEN